MKKFLVIGSGGREHSLAWKLSQEAEVHVTPGNPGIAVDVETHGIKQTNFEGISDLAKRIGDVTVLVGPEAPLIDGLADRLRAQGIPVFGPGSKAARLEGSKAFSKNLMRESGVRTARFQTFHDSSAAKDFASELVANGHGVVVKASGNALGKGAVVCEDLHQAHETIHQMIEGKIFGDAGSEIVVEQRLSGKEFSLLTLVSDFGIQSLPVAQDYKRVDDGDNGPNTGGMGSYSPVNWVDDTAVQKTEKDLVMPILEKLKEMNLAYRGVLFTGVMMERNEPYCLEYNVRFGDPETQSLMLQLGDGFCNAVEACALGKPIPKIEVLEGFAVTVVVASEGYPDSPQKGFEISFHPEPVAGPNEKVKLFHAGTAIQEGKMVNSGGRVFGCSAYSNSLEQAGRLAYKLAATIHFEGACFRNDIAKNED